MRKILIGFLVLILSLALTGCGGEKEGGAGAREENKIVLEQSAAASGSKISGEIFTVVISNNKFIPAELEIQAGDTVEWVNDDDKTHTVSFENGDFDEELPEGEAVSYTFNGAGEAIGYFCRMHPGVRGSVITG